MYLSLKNTNTPKMIFRLLTLCVGFISSSWQRNSLEFHPYTSLHQKSSFCGPVWILE